MYCHYYPMYAEMPYYYGMSYYFPYSYPYQSSGIYREDEFRQQNDYGRNPYVVNIEQATERNRNFRSAIWTGRHLQLVLMSLGAGEEIGLEVHPNTDQFICIEEGRGIVRMGDSPNWLNFERQVSEDDAILIPAGTWHNVINTGNRPLKLYTIYAPPEHPFGTLQPTKQQQQR